MYNMNDILARLRNGETAEDIAKDFTTAINEASSAYAAETREAEKRKEKIEAARKAIIAMNEYMRVCHPDAAMTSDLLMIEDMSDEKCEQLIETVDAIINFYEGCATAFAPIKLTVKSAKEPVAKQPTDLDSIFSNFFREMKII